MSLELKAQKWIDSKQVDEATKASVKAMLDATENTELTECFYKDLEFGTGGLRGIMGVGSNRMNRYTIGMATQGLSNYIKHVFAGEQISAAIAYDSRNNSRFFAETTAAVFSANGIQVFLFESLRPTPELSFAIRELGCKTGIVLTASHNPKEYNGYKAYWNDGAQMVAPHDTNVIDEVEKIKSIDDVKFDANPALIKEIGADIDAKYLDTLAALSLSPEVIKAQCNIPIVYSSIHGTGIKLVPPILERFGFKNVTIVEEQANPDGNFPTVIYPNPEEAEALSLAIKKAKEVGAELVMATDPDADRVGIAVKSPDGDYKLLNGNQTGTLLLYYLARKWKENGKINGKQFMVKTIVTTDLIAKIAKHYDIKLYDTLTGFKFIAAVIKDLEGKETFIGGGEESYGYLIGDAVRDKDAIASCAMIAEMAAWVLSQGMTILELLEKIHFEFGLFQESLKSITKKGKTGAEEITAMMVKFRNTPPTTLAGSAVTQVIDYKLGIQKNLLTKTETTIDYPSSDVLQFITEDETKVSVRPSGTEPKIKFYFSVKHELNKGDNYSNALASLDLKTEKIIKDLEL
jgi:phosphoglucomutase